MNNEESGSPVSSNEQLARFILASNWIRKVDQTIKPDAFIPYPYPDLSVTRHGNLSAQVLWRVGQDIADARPSTLHGRADIRADAVRGQMLEVVSQPVTNNPNHANVTGWPTDKPAQKIIAQELAAAATFVPKP